MTSRYNCGIACPAPRMMLIAVAACLAGASVQADDSAAPAPAAGDPSAAAPVAKPPVVLLEARLTDGSVFHVKLLDESIPLATEFGKLSIPVAAIRSIDFATRVPRATAERVKAAISRLGDKDFQVREAASAELLALDAAAYAAVKAAVNSPDAEVVLRADRLLAQWNTALPEQQRENFPLDVVYANGSQIEGTIELDSLKVETLPFGTQQLKIEMLRQLGTGLEVDETPTAVLPDPGVLMNFQGQTGRTLYFRISAAANGLQNGAVWGSDMYTTDSQLALAALHAGVLKPGETKVVGVNILGPQNAFGSSTRNGVETMPWGQFPSAFKFKTPKNAPARRGNVQNNR